VCRAQQLRRLVERSRLSPVRVATLLLLAAVEDTVTQPEDGLRLPVVSDADARADVRLIPGNKVFRNLAHGNLHVREGGGESGRQRRVLVLARRDEQSHGLEIEVRLAGELLWDGGGYLVTQAQA